MSSSNDGRLDCNRVLGRSESLINAADLKRLYLHGLESKDNQGNPITDETLQQYIEIAVSMLEHDLDIAIVEREITEEKDYYGNDYWDWGFLQLNNIPVIEVKELKVTYLRDENGVPENILSIPTNWIRLREHDGTIRLVPNNKFPASLQVDASGTFFPEIFRRHSNVPQLWTVVYTAGFKSGKIPKLINTAIGLLAGILVFNNAADLILGTGIASQSISIDGLSQAITTTASAENHTYSAKVKEYYKLLFGESINSPNRGIIRILRDYYQGERMTII